MIRIRLDFALLLIDDFSGRTLTGPDCRFTVAGRAAAAQRKEEGYYVFSGLGEVPPYEAEIRRPGYRARRVTAGAPGAELEVRLLRADGCFPDCEFLRGACRPGARMLALSRPGKRLLSLTKGVEADRLLLDYDPADLTRLRFCLGEGAGREDFLLTARGEDGGYAADRSFRFPHRPGEPVLRAYYTVCEEDGSYRIPVDPGEGGNIEDILVYEEGKGQWECWSRTEHS